MIIDESDYLEHYGILRRSGRYPWGSGGPEYVSDDPHMRNKTFLDHVAALRKQGLKETEIAQGMGISTTQLRAAKTIARQEQRQAKILEAQRLRAKGMGSTAAAAQMGIPEPTYRSLLEPGAADKNNVLIATADMLRKEVDEKKWVDVGLGTESHLNISQQKLDAALDILKEEGYVVHTVKHPQATTGFDTKRRALGLPGTTQRDLFFARNDIQQLTSVSGDGGRSWGRIHEPISIHPDRVAVKYKEEGGDKADGVIYVRRGVDELSMGKARYAQVRVKVGDDHYLKGMAMYKDDLPDGVDLLFNTNKSDTGNKLDAMKELKKDDPDFPFGSYVRQLTKDTGTPNERVVSAMNIVNEEGQWTKWSRNISAQALSKQVPSLAKDQLDRTFNARKAEFEEIMSLTNPVVKKKLLKTFSDATDASAVHMKAAALDRQNWHVILPIESMPPHQIYAPKYRNGERVVLIRYPHGGRFEIPELIVNNNHPEAKRVLGDAADAVGIHHSVAERLSGADFDGDTVLVIPNNSNRIKTVPALEKLKGFDPMMYKQDDSLKPKTPAEKAKVAQRKQRQMGEVSNLITDMTLRGASHQELSQAVRHSMVVIDSEKHNLNTKQSAIDHGILALKRQYQAGEGSRRGGASTLISRAGARKDVPDRKERPAHLGGPIDKETGQKVYVPTGKFYINKDGKRVEKTIRSKKLAETDDAHTLVSKAPGTRVEHIYADHSNRLKAMANQARLEMIGLENIKVNPSAKRVYAKEVKSLDAKLALARKNAPLERHAQAIAAQVIAAKKAANPGLADDTLKKVRFSALNDARIRMGVNRKQIEITPEEWNAIQAGAITQNKLEQILNNSDVDVIRKFATPRPERLMTSAKKAQALRLLAGGATRAEVADRLGVSVSTLDAATIGDAEDDGE